MKDDSRDWTPPPPGGGSGLGTYILNAERQAIEVDTNTWAEWIEVERRKPLRERLDVVGTTEIPGYGFASTVFMGLDHGYHRWNRENVEAYRPILFETMSFQRAKSHKPETYMGRRWRRRHLEDDVQVRCCTWDEAVAQHAQVVALLRRHGKELHRLRMAGDTRGLARRRQKLWDAL